MFRKGWIRCPNMIGATNSSKCLPRKICINFKSYTKTFLHGTGVSPGRIIQDKKNFIIKIVRSNQGYCLQLRIGI